MSKETINYEIEDRELVLSNIAENGWQVDSDTTIDLVNGRLTNCYFVVETEPPTAPPDPLLEELEALRALAAEQAAALLVFGIPEEVAL